jgi:hypothetical protein
MVRWVLSEVEKFMRVCGKILKIFKIKRLSKKFNFNIFNNFKQVYAMKKIQFTFSCSICILSWLAFLLCLQRCVFENTRNRYGELHI